MKKIDLNGIWQARCFEDGKQKFEFSGSVPGCVHTDLLGTHIDKDIYYRDNTENCQWIENCDFEYTKEFTLDTVPSFANLVFCGLDTYADIFVNGKKIAYTENMFIEHTFSVAEHLQVGKNNITVYFHSPIKKVEGLPLRNGAFTRERFYTRRIQCTYGWDWVARYVTCGIWRDVYLDLNTDFDINHTYIYTESIDTTTAQIVVECEFKNFENGGFAEMEIVSPDGETVYKNRVFSKEEYRKDYIDIPNAKLWYPAGYGEQPLYTLKICGKEYKFGIRTVRVLQEPDLVGSPYYNKCLEIKTTPCAEVYDHNTEFSGFLLLVNNTPIMCKGANWVPCEPFPSAEKPEKITTLLTLAKQSGLNMLRVWGGGIFEQQHFYNECDRLGILVTQDFLMACGHYPEEDPAFIEQLKKETEFAAYALRNHPCIMWWSGDNENAILGYDDAEDYQGRTCIYKGIMPILAKLDPRRRFMLSSPCYGKYYASKTAGTTHNTQYLGKSIFPYILNTDMSDYKEHFGMLLARFIAEEPAMGATSRSSLLRFMTESDIYDSLDMWEYHTKGNPALPVPLFEYVLKFAEKVLGAFKDGHDRFFKLKYMHYEWIRFTMENIRRNRGFCNGIIYWMFNDCWPSSSGWSIVDYYCKPKSAYYSFKRCAANLLASIDKKEGYDIHLCNDALCDKQVEFKLYYILDGKATHVCDKTATAVAATSQKVFTLPLDAIPENAALICDAYCGNEHSRAFYKNGALFINPCDSVKVTAKTENSITIKADSYVHTVEIEGEYVFSDNFFSLLPGEERTVTFEKTVDAKTSEITVEGYTI